MVEDKHSVEAVERKIGQLERQSNLSATEALKLASEIASDVEELASAVEGTGPAVDRLRAGLYDIAVRAFAIASARTEPPEDAYIVGRQAAAWATLRDGLSNVAATVGNPQLFETGGLHTDTARERSSARLMLGLQYRRDGILDAALQQIRKALEADPGSVMALVEFGRTALYEGSTACDEGIGLIEQALASRYHEPRLYMTLANLYQFLDRKSDAERTLREGIGRFGHDAKLHANLGQLLWLRSSQSPSLRERAIIHARVAVGLDPSLAIAKNNLAYYLAESGRDLGEAKALISEAIESDPDNPYYWDTRATVFMREGDITEALNAVKQSLQYSPNRPIPHLHLAELYAASDDKVSAREEAALALQLAEGDSDLLEFVRRTIREVLGNDETSESGTTTAA